MGRAMLAGGPSHFLRASLLPILPVAASLTGAVGAHAQGGPALPGLGAEPARPASEAGAPSMQPLQGAGVATSAGAPGSFSVGAVVVDGATMLPRTVFAGAIETVIGQTLDQQGLQNLARSIAQIARERGYIFASAQVPAQNVQLGIVRIALDPGAISAVRIVGSDNRKLRTILDRIVGDAPVKAEVERQLLLAEDLPGITILSTNYVREGNDGILVVKVREQRLSGSAVVDNWGSREYGPVRARLSVDLNSLVEDGDTLSVSALNSVAQPRELSYVSLRYAVPVGRDGAQIGLSAAAGFNRPGGEIARYSLSGESRYLAVFGTYPLLRGPDSSLWVNVEMAHLRVDQSVFDTLVQRDDTTTLTLSFSGNQKLASGRLNWGVGVTQGLDLFRDDAAEVGTSRPDGTADFTRGFAWVNWFGDLGGKLSLRIAANAQLSAGPLLAAYEIGYGGPYVGRGYNFTERFGDQGVMGLIELRRGITLPLPAYRWGHLYTFIDAGHLTNLSHGFGGGSLASAGAGVRFGLSRFELGLEGALPLTEVRLESGDRRPKVNFYAGVSF